MAYRATRTEGRVTVGAFTADLTKGQIVNIKPSAEDENGNPFYEPEEVANYLIDQGLLIEVDDDAVDNAWFDSDDPDLANPPANTTVVDLNGADYDVNGNITERDEADTAGVEPNIE